MSDIYVSLDDAANAKTSQVQFGRRRKLLFRAFKFGIDLILSALLFPVMLLIGVFLLVLNPFFNRGPLFYTQERMGKGCKPFVAIKFRSMLPAETVHRDSSSPVEVHRLTPFGKFMRRCRIDELPQIINVFKGEMSLIGPRPDYMPHAQEFLSTVPGYRERHAVRPGISGLAQTEIGYAVGALETRRKVLADLHYIRRSGFLMEAWIFWRTVRTVFGLRGS